MIRLQSFSHRVSGYERPNQPWICGWAATGQPCRTGPDHHGSCPATMECQPLRKGDRWECTRPATGGGRCAAGPLPDGTCSRPVPPCVPVRSQRSRRGQITKLLVAAVLALLAIPLGLKSAAWLVEPGRLSAQHAGILQCSGCHTSFAAGPFGWLRAAFNDAPRRAMVPSCLACHDIGRHPLAAHGLDTATLNKLGQGLVTMEGPAPSGGAGKPAPIVPAAFTLPQVARREAACSACHREHKGAHAQLTSVNNAVCQTCHVVRFTSLANGHPDFHAFPFRRRTRIIFDHAKHFDQHFERSAKSLVPSGCTGCHAFGAGGNAIVVKPFAVACGGCHVDEIRGKDSVGDKGIAVLGVPGLDLQTLRARGAAIGNWPAEADADIGPFLRFLLARRPETARDLAALGDVSIGDLSHASDAQIAAAARIAWAIKDLLFDLSVKGPSVLAQPDAREGSRTPSQLADLVGGLPPDAIKTAEKQWFPNLADEVARHRAGERVPMSGQTPAAGPSAPVPAKPEAGEQGAISGTGNGAILGGGTGLLGGGATAQPAAPAAAASGPASLPAPTAGGQSAIAGTGSGAILGGGTGLLGGGPKAQPAAPAAAASEPASPPAPTAGGQSAIAGTGNGAILGGGAGLLGGGAAAQPAAPAAAASGPASPAAPAAGGQSAISGTGNGTILGGGTGLLGGGAAAQPAAPAAAASGPASPAAPAAGGQSTIAGTGNGAILGGGTGLLGGGATAQPSAPAAAASEPASAPASAAGGQSAIAGTGSGAILGGGAGLLGGAPAAQPPAPAAAVAPPEHEKPQAPEPMDNETWTALGGGWYRLDFQLYYRPVGHADTFMHAWLDVTGREMRGPTGSAQLLFKRLSEPTAPGVCAKCHSIDNASGGARIVNWLPFQPDREQHDFTKFSHRPHLNLFGATGCKTCHQIDEKADVAASYKRGDPFVFAASFKPIKREACANCHVAGRASASCGTCHNYHIGQIPQALGVTTTGIRQSARTPSEVQDVLFPRRSDAGGQFLSAARQPR